MDSRTKKNRCSAKALALGLALIAKGVALVALAVATFMTGFLLLVLTSDALTYVGGGPSGMPAILALIGLEAHAQMVSWGLLATWGALLLVALVKKACDLGNEALAEKERWADLRQNSSPFRLW